MLTYVRQDLVTTSHTSSAHRKPHGSESLYFTSLASQEVTTINFLSPPKEQRECPCRLSDLILFLSPPVPVRGRNTQGTNQKFGNFPALQLLHEIFGNDFSRQKLSYDEREELVPAKEWNNRSLFILVSPWAYRALAGMLFIYSLKTERRYIYSAL